MSTYYVWFPTIKTVKEKATLHFFLTPGDAGYEILGGSQEFAKQILSDLELSVEPESWHIVAYRTKYFSDYLGEDDWRDNWQVVWKVEIGLKNDIDFSPPNEIYFPTTAIDDSWTDKNALDHNDPINCLIIGDFQNSKDLKRVQATIESNKRVLTMQMQSGIRQPHFYAIDIYQRSKQLHVDLGKFQGDFYADGAKYAEYVTKIIKQTGGTVHYEDLKL